VTSPDVLGFSLSDGPELRTVDAGGRTLRVFGSVHSPAEFLLGEASDDGSTWVVDVATRQAHRLNQDRASTERYLAAFGDYLRDGPADTAMVLTAQQASERLALLRAGKIKPGVPARRPVAHEVRLRRLLDELRAIDPEAAEASWWSGTIEQAEDDLL
jgi:hypothetical protein